MKTITLLFIQMILGFSLAFSQGDIASEYETLTFESSVGKNLPYRFLKPNQLETKDGKFPLVIFLHGAGERGNDNQTQLVHGATLFSDKANREKYPAFVIFPQCPEKKKWVEVDWTLSSHKMPKEATTLIQSVLELKDSLMKIYPIDPSRIYLVGLSMGGFGVWDLITRFPDKFAAAVPICGGGDEGQCSKITTMPIWAFHGDRDRLVKTCRSQNMIASIRKSGGDPKYVEYKDVGHLCWNKAFGEKGLLEWLFSQKKK
jgi:predicted peptidase